VVRGSGRWGMRDVREDKQWMVVKWEGNRSSKVYLVREVN